MEERTDHRSAVRGSCCGDLEWTECQLKKAVLRSDIDQDVIVSYQGKEQRVKLDAEASCDWSMRDRKPTLS